MTDPREYEHIIILCPPAEKSKQLEIGIKNLTPDPESRRDLCEHCLCPVFIGPKQVAARKKLAATVLCTKCAVDLAKRNKFEMDVQHLGGKGAKYET